MARSAINDALEKFRFLVDFTLPGSIAPIRTGFHDVQMPKRTTNKVNYREGHDPDVHMISAGLSTMEDLVMSRGIVATDGATANDFYKWISAVHAPTPGQDKVDGSKRPTGALDYRSEVTIQMLDRAGTIVRAWKLYQAFPVHFVPGSDLNSVEDGDKSMEALTLAYEDFQEMRVVAGAVQTTSL